MDRKRLIMLTQVANFLVSASLAALALTGSIQVWHLYATTVATSVLMILEQPARSALVPSIVPRSHMMNAFTLNSFVRQGSLLVGPAFGGSMIDIGGGGTDGAAFAYVAALVFYVPVFGTLALLRIPARAGLETTTRQRGFKLVQIGDGLKYIWGTNVLLAIITLDAGVALLTGYRGLLPVFASDVLSSSGSILGLLVSAPAVGFVIGSFLLLLLGRLSRTGLIVLLSVAGYAIALGLFALSTTFWLSFLFLVLVGGLDGISSIVRQTTLQLIVPDEIRGRASSVQQVLAVGSPSIGQFLAGVVAAPMGAPNAVLLGSVMSLVFVGLVALRWRELLSFRGVD
jgi:MFS family permease